MKLKNHKMDEKIAQLKRIMGTIHRDTMKVNVDIFDKDLDDYIPAGFEKFHSTSEADVYRNGNISYFKYLTDTQRKDRERIRLEMELASLN